MATIDLTQLVKNGLLIRVGEGKRDIRYTLQNYAKEYAKELKIGSELIPSFDIYIYGIQKKSLDVLEMETLIVG